MKTNPLITFCIAYVVYQMYCLGIFPVVPFNLPEAVEVVESEGGDILYV